MLIIKAKWNAQAIVGGLGLLLVFGLVLLSPTFCLAQAQIPDRSSRQTADGMELTPAEALANTRKTGVPTLVLVTSEANPNSIALWDGLQESWASLPRRKPVQILHIAIEDLGKTAKTLGITRAPAVLVYCRENGKVRLAGQHAGPMDVEFIDGWLGLFRRDDQKSNQVAAKDRTDSEIVRATAYQDYASAQSTPQYQQPAPPAKNPPQQPVYQQQPPAQQQYYPPQQQYYAPPMMPVYQPQQPPMQMVYAPAPPPVYVQQTAPTIMMAPAPAPNIISMAPAPGPGSAPPMSMAPPNLLAPPASAPPMGPPPSAPPMGPPSYGSAPPMGPPIYASAPPMAYAPAPVAYAPPPVAYAPAPSGFVAAAPSPILTNPRLFGRLLGTLGESLVDFGSPRIRMARSPAYASAAFGSVDPAPAYPATRVYPVKRVREPVEEEYVEEQPTYQAPRPSPQGSSDGHSLRNLFRKHDSN